MEEAHSLVFLQLQEIKFVSFFVHYNGGTNTNANSYDIFVTKNGQFRPGSVGV